MYNIILMLFMVLTERQIFASHERVDLCTYTYMYIDINYCEKHIK